MKLKTRAISCAGTLLSKELLIQRSMILLLMIAATASAMAKETNKSLVNSSITNLVQTVQEAETITGIITDDGQPLSGVTIQLKNSSTTTTSNNDGQYSISIPNRDAVLQFSMVGYETRELSVGNSNRIDVALIASLNQLDDIIVVGYGEQKKTTLTGSVVDVSGEELTKSPSANVTASLQGKLPGLVAVQRSGEPGRDDANILIRGNGTTGNNSPLIIIDGVERSLIGRLNNEDIESVSVLKDASAAIYGARAANGVILVTTKKGKIGKPEFSVSLNNAFNTPTKVPDMLDAVTFAQAYNEGNYYRAGRPENFADFYSPDVIQKLRDGSDPILYPNTDWMGEIVKNYSLQQRVNMQVTGGSEAVRYLLSFGAMNQNGDFKSTPTSYKQFNYRGNIDVNITENLTLGANVSAILSKKTYPIVGNDINFVNLLQASPLLVSRYPNGLIAPGRFGESPLTLDQRGFNRTNDEPIYSTFTLAYKVPFVEGLRVDASYNYDLSHVFQKRFSKPYTYHEYNVNTEEYDLKQGTGASTVELWDRFTRYTTKLYNYRVTYEKTFGGVHNIMAMLGQEQQQNTMNWTEAYRKNFVSSAIDQINAGSSAAEDKNNGGNATAGAYNSFLGRLTYDYKAKYLFESSFRYNGSQNFPTSTRYGFFPAVQAGWRISEESFFQEAVPFVNNLKVRATYGEVGNDRVNQYQYLQLFSLGGNYVFGSNDAAGVTSGTLPNPNITWEVSKKADFGLEASLWQGLLGVDFTYFTEKRTNILAARNLSIPAILGFPSLPNENIGKVDNKGYEIILNHRNTVNELRYSISANMGYVKSKVVFLDETPNPDAPWKSVTGHPVGAGLIYQADGIFHTQAELDAYPHQSGTQVGDIKIVDYNNDGKIDSDDQFRFDKTSTPEIVFGTTMNFQWRSLDLNLFLQGQTNVYNYDGNFANLGNQNFTNAFVARAKDRWTETNPNGTMPRADGFSPGTNTFFLYDATFVRLKSLELGWTAPQRLSSIVGLNSLRFYVSGFNLLTWAKENKWSDPEGTTALIYPQLRTINLGLNVKF